MVERHRVQRTPAQVRQAEYEARQRAEEERIKQERADREALEVERLRQLRDAQISPSDYHGYDLPDYRYSGTDYSFQPEPTYYRPPTGWNYETDTPEITYYEMFGEPSLADIDRVNAELDELLTSQAWSQAERQQIEDTRASFLAGEISPHSMNVQNMYAEFNIKERGEFADKIADAGYEGYSLQATNLAEAKAQADEVYMGVLRNAYEENPNDKLKKAIEQGPLDFDKIEDVKLYDSLSEDSIQRQAFDAQGAVVEDYLNRSDNRVFDTRMLEQGETVSLGYQGSTSQFMLNTGTIIGAPTASADNIQFGEFGTYGNLSWNDPPEPSTFEKNLSFGLDILSLVYPPLAPAFQGSKALVQGGDLEDALKAGVTTYVGGKVTKELTNHVNDVLDSFEITIPDMPEPVKQTLVDTTAGVILGQDPDEAFTNSLTRQATDYVTDWAAGEIESKYGDLGQDLKEFLNLPEDYELPESLQNIIDEGTEALVSGDSATEAIESAAEGEVRDVVGGFVEDTTKDLLSGAEDLLGEGLSAFDDTVIQPIIAPIKPVLTAVGDVVEDVIIDPADEVIDYIGDSPVVETIEDIGKDIGETFETVVTEPVDKVIDYIGDEYVDPAIKTVKEGGEEVITTIKEALPHGTTPESPDIDIDLDLPSPDIEIEQPESKVAGLFDKELREIYKHDIIELPKLFSDERLEGMLSRKYRV